MENSNNNKKSASFKMLKNGPVQVSGNFVLKDTAGNIIETKEPIFLCRCGGSGRKPFCDGSHRRVGLRD